MKTKLKNLFFLLKKYNFVEVGLVRHLSDNFIILTLSYKNLDICRTILK